MEVKLQFIELHRRIIESWNFFFRHIFTTDFFFWIYLIIYGLFFYFLRFCFNIYFFLCYAPACFWAFSSLTYFFRFWYLGCYWNGCKYDRSRCNDCINRSRNRNRRRRRFFNVIARSSHPVRTNVIKINIIDICSTKFQNKITLNKTKLTWKCFSRCWSWCCDINVSLLLQFFIL